MDEPDRAVPTLARCPVAPSRRRISEGAQRASRDYREMPSQLTLKRWFLEKEKPLVEPQLFAILGVGDSRCNDFWLRWGVGARASHVESGAAVVSPARIDWHFPLLRRYRFAILRSPRIGPGELIGRRGGFQSELTAAFSRCDESQERVSRLWGRTEEVHPGGTSVRSNRRARASSSMMRPSLSLRSRQEDTSVSGGST